MSCQSSVSSSSSGTQKMQVTEGPPSTSEVGKNEARKGGISMGMAAFFIVTQIAGAGFLALPHAMANTGWLGVVMMLVFCWGVGFSGAKLGACWVILEERWPHLFAEGSRRPFMDMAEKALGRPGRILALTSLLISVWGACVGFFILMGYFFHELVDSVTICAWMLIVATVVMPFTWLGTPKDFWQISVVAVVSTALACLVIFIELMLEIPKDFPPEYGNPTVFTFALGFSSILFAFGGAPVFPTIQNDMVDRSLMSRSVVVAFIILLMMYMPVAVGGYVVKGSDVNGIILLGVDTSKWWIKMAIVMEIVNLVGTYIVGLNPLSQFFEGLLDIEEKFSWRRCLIRSCLVLSEVLVALAVRNFNKILNLIGGSTITLGAFCLPGIIYLRLCDMEGDWERKEVPLWERTALILIVSVGVVGGIVATASAVWDLIDPESLGESCFVNFSG